MISNNFKQFFLHGLIITVLGFMSGCSGKPNQPIDYRETAQTFLNSQYGLGTNSIYHSVDTNPTAIHPKQKLADTNVSEIRTISLRNNFKYYTSSKKYEALLDVTEWDEIAQGVTLSDGATIFHLNTDGTMKTAETKSGEFKVIDSGDNSYMIEDWRDDELFITRFYSYNEYEKLVSTYQVELGGAPSDSMTFEYTPAGHLKKVIKTGGIQDNFNYESTIEYDDENMEVTGTFPNGSIHSNFSLKILSDNSYIYKNEDGVFEVTLDDSGRLLSRKQDGSVESMSWDNREISRISIKEEISREQTDKGFQLTTKRQLSKNQTQLRTQEFWLDEGGNAIALLKKSDDEIAGPQLDVTHAEYAYFKYR